MLKNYELQEMKEFKQQDGTIVKVGMEVKYSPWVVDGYYGVERNDKEEMLFGKVVAIKECYASHYHQEPKDLKKVEFHIFSSKVTHANFPSKSDSEYHLRKLGEIIVVNSEDWKPVGDNEPNFVGYKLGMITGYMHADNLFAEIVRQKDMVFTWFVKRQYNVRGRRLRCPHRGKQVDSVIGTIVSQKKEHFFVTRHNIKLDMTELKTIHVFLDRLNTRNMFSIYEPIQCAFCKKTMYVGYIKCREKSSGTGYKGKGAVCEKCCYGLGCQACNTARKTINKCHGE